MPKDKKTKHVLVLEAAREEFQKYGFEKASMRRIGDRAGMTAAGLYRHCKDKEDLFRELVAPAVERLQDWLDGHISRNVQALESGTVDLWKDSQIDMMREIVYPNREEYRLLLTKSQGTKYENFLHDLVEQHQRELLKFLPRIRESGYLVQEIDPKELHLLLSAYTTALFEPVIHDYSEEEALRSLEIVEKFFLPGWKNLLGC
ncbi:MAG: helix-turn-helix transcriptional regulator [Oscillospiraceae bacterium]|nr:helix-turn-helix transcriptional regulator [Oscillospiraceae bacterium]